MDKSQQLMFALQSPVGLRFGAAVDVDADRITFEMDLKIPKGTECSFRMELSGEDDTIMGKVRIERKLPARGSDLPRYQARILEIPIDDRQRFDGWRRDMSTGGVSRRIERDPEQLRTQISNKMMGGATEAESKAVLDRMNAKRSNRRKEEGYVEGDPLGLSVEEEATRTTNTATIREKLREEQSANVGDPGPSQAEKEAARESMSNAIIDELSLPEKTAPSWMPEEEPGDSSVQAAPPVEPATPAAASKASAVPSPTPVPAPTKTLPPAQKKRIAPPAPAKPDPAAESIPRPMVVVDADSSPIAVTIIYLSHESFVQDYHATLHTSAITIDHPGLNQLYHPVRVRIQFANGDVMDLMGQMVAPLPHGMAIALELDGSQRDHLRQHAES